MSCVSKLYKVSHFLIDLSTIVVANKKRIPNNISFVNAIMDPIFVISTKFGVINARPNQPADKLLKTAESALRNGEYLFTISHTLTEDSLFRQERRIKPLIIRIKGNMVCYKDFSARKGPLIIF